MVHHKVGDHADDRAARAGNGPRAPIKGFSHLMFEVRDLDRSEAFYRDVLGMKVGFRYED